jgi:S-DNA-T family DNA segregation ATPase FtsK/SpoIIIE
MAKRKSRKKSENAAPNVEKRRDLEALSLFLFGAALLFAAALYLPLRFTSKYTGWVRELSLGNLGVLALVIPPVLLIAAALLLLDRPIRPFLRAVGLIVLAGVIILPVLAGLGPDPLGGQLGIFLYNLLHSLFARAWILVPPILLTFVGDLALRQRPGYLLMLAFRRVALAGSRLKNAYRLSAQASGLLREVRVLSERYPDHKAIGNLQKELEHFRNTPQQTEELGQYREVLSGFVSDRARELAGKVAGEQRPLAARLERLLSALAQPLSGDGLAHALEERRAALVLEAGALLSKVQTLAKKGDEIAGWLNHPPKTGALLAEWDAHQTRLEQWQHAEEATKDVETRTDSWLRWAEWTELAPKAALPGGLRALLESGLTNTPPDYTGVMPPTEELPPNKTAETVQASSDELDIRFDENEVKAAEVKTPVMATAQPPAPPKTAAPPKPKPRRSTSLHLPKGDLLEAAEISRFDPKTLDLMTRRMVETIDQTLQHFGLEAKVVAWSRGPTVTRYELEPAPGEKISRIASLANDLARALSAGSVRIEAPIPGKSVIGLEVPNAERELVRFSEAVGHSSFARSREVLPLILGKSIEGEVWVRDLARMPHLLIAGSTGSGKSVAINTLVCSLLFKYVATDLRFLMIDPKMVELTPYEGIPHLVRPVVTNPADAAGVLLGAVAHMERRYKMMSQVGARSLDQFNAKMKAAGEPQLPYMVIVIDELADLMITAPKEVEQAILRLAQMARATGMHLVLATQRPSVDILTSLIKVNVPARMAFAVSSGFDSRTILDSIGAERLVGQGDMLYHQPGLPKPVRLQGPFLSEVEVHRLADFLRSQSFDDHFVETYGPDFEGPLNFGSSGGSNADEIDFGDPLLKRAAEIVIEEGYASVSRLQRRLSVGHARAGKLVDALEAMGIVGPHQGSKPREVTITRDQIDEYFGRDWKN